MVSNRMAHPTLTHASQPVCEGFCVLLCTAVNFLWMSAGLLLNNLSVYHGCEIVFDSSEVPGQAMSVATDVPDVQVSIRTSVDILSYALHSSIS